MSDYHRTKYRQFINLSKMSEGQTRKSWDHKEIVTLSSIVDDLEKPINWSFVAKKMAAQIVGSDRTGKQCRQRWNWEISKKSEASKQDSLDFHYFFSVYRAFKNQKNKWKQIAATVEQQTKCSWNQNQIKNFFYCSVRKALRKINKIVNRKYEPSHIRNLKPNSLSVLCSSENQSDQYLKIFQNILTDSGSQIQQGKLQQILHHVIELDKQYVLQKSQNFSPEKHRSRKFSNESSSSLEFPIYPSRTLSDNTTYYGGSQKIELDQLRKMNTKKLSQECQMFFPSVFEISEVQSVNISPIEDDDIGIFFNF